MHVTALAFFLGLSRTATAMCAAGLALLLIGLWASRRDLASARGLDKVVALANLCYALPLAVFGALHFFGPQFVQGMVPHYMPGRMFWVYFVGCALIAASLSIATRIAVRWSGLLVGIMMFLFVAMLYLPSGLRHLHDLKDFAEYTRRGYRYTWIIVFRESSFGAAGWLLAASARKGWGGRTRAILLTVGRIVISLAAIFFGIQHFLYRHQVPVVPLQKLMPAWVPAPALIDCVTGAALVAAGVCFLLAIRVRAAATWLGAWILLLVLVIYGPILIGALSSTDIEMQVEGINYFADTLFFAGVILALASATPGSLAQKLKGFVKV